MVDIVRPPLRLPRPFENQPSPSQPQPPQPPQPSPLGDFGQPPEQGFDDGVRMVDPNTGQPVVNELDQIDLPPLSDYLRASYQVLGWAAESLKQLAMKTPALTGLSPGIESTVDQIATIGYQVTNAGAEVTRALWNWPYSRVIINKQLEQFIHPQEWSTFDVLYIEWYQTFVAPSETPDGKGPTKEELAEWMKSKEEIADPQGFLSLCLSRLRMERAAQKSAWSPTDMLSLQRPTGTRQRTTTDLYKVFRKKPG